MRFVMTAGLLALVGCTSSKSTEERLSTLITLNMTAPVREVVRAVADRADVEVEFGDGVGDPLGLTSKDVPFRDLIDGICKTMNLTWRQIDESRIRIERRRT